MLKKVLICLVVFVPGSASADTPARLLHLISIPGVSGYEQLVREFIELSLPVNARVRADNMGNIVIRTGSGAPHTLVVAPLDEGGLVVSAITPDGYLRVHRPTRAPAPRLSTQYLIGQPIEIRTATGQIVPGVTAAPSTHLRSFREPRDESRMRGVRKKFVPLGATRATGRAMDDRNGSTALLLALGKIDPAKLTSRVTFAWAVEEETGLAGVAFIATEVHPHTAFAIDTFVSSDTPVEEQRAAGAKLGQGAVLRGLDGQTLVQPQIVDRIVRLARARKIPLQIGVTGGGTDASAFSAGGAIDVGLSWPGRYSHSPVEVMDRRDLEALVNLIATLALEY